MRDRRNFRSSDPYQALRLQLETTRAHSGLDAMVLAMPNGLLVAGAGAPDVCEALGAVAPLLGRRGFSTARLPLSQNDNGIDVRLIDVAGEQLVLATMGQQRLRGAWLEKSERGVRRILDNAA